MTSASDLPSPATGRRTQWAVAAVVVGLIAVLLITGYLFARSVRLEEAQSLAESDAIARGVAASIETREQGHLNVLLSYAGRFRFRETVKRKDRAEALVHLRQLAESFPDVDRPFLTDPSGVMWAIYPEAPQSLGRSFADRDWYKGVSRDWRPYMSEVYAQFRDGALAVALAVPIRDLDGAIIGIIVSPQRLEVIRQWLLPIQVPNGDLYVVDRKGQLVFHRTQTGPDRLSDYARAPVVERLLKGEEGVEESESPVEHEVRLSAYRLLPSLGWGVVVYRSKNLALQRTRTLMLVSGVAGLLLTAALAVIGLMAIRDERQAVAALAERKRAEEALRASEARNRLIVNTAYDAFVAIDADGLITDWNRQAEILFGWSREQAIGRSLAETIIPPQYREAHTRGLRHFLATGEGPVLNKRIEVTALHRDGHAFPVELTITPIRMGQSYIFSAFVHDITERKQAEEALRQAKQEADRANQAKSEFLSRMSHELRTPLNAILGFGQVLEMDPLPPEQGDSVGQILKAGRHLLGLIDEVLDIARIEAGRLQLSLEPVHVRTVLDEARSMIRPLAAERNVGLQVDVSEASDLYVLADRQRLKQVLLNLLSNAVKYDHEGGTVTVRCEEVAGSRLRFKVSDTGPGIPPEKLRHLFTPFERLGIESSGVEGTGLGLALSKALAEAMGGALGVESEVGRGSTFWVELPRAESLEAEVVRVAIDAPGGPVLRQGSAVLYIEDNLSNVKLIEHVLARRSQVRLLTAMQGRLGLDLAREHRPGLIVLDVHLPDISGGDVLRQLREDSRTRDIPVVILSADASPSQIRRFLDDGAREYLTKPIDVRKFLAILDETLRTKG